MYLVGFWGQVPESLSSTKPIAGPDDLKNWKFRSPPGMETEIFERLGASPVVMDFGAMWLSTARFASGLFSPHSSQAC
jgi:TRAP-type C4-dicarboxylate transport system substrate-binding protein